MCDTIVASPDTTAERIMLFGKNSDRQRNEAQIVEHHPRAQHVSDAQLACTYIAIPQVRLTYGLLISRPFWIWGAEMGVNEHGVAIGNEALRARSVAPATKALTGMDLVRLGLERASTAAEAVSVVTTLLGQFGQGGNCGHITPSFYNNGFFIVDPREAFVLETVGREWLVERVRGVRSISNRYTIGPEPQEVSAGLPTLIRDSGWCTAPRPNYAEVIADSSTEHIGNAGARRACSTSLLSARAGRLTSADMMSILRDHGTGDRYHPQWRSECAIQRTLCMHAGDEERSGQTVGSMVAELRQQSAVHWVTGTAAPCISVFKPALIEAPLPAHGPSPNDRFDVQTLWWRHEQLHRSALAGDFGQFVESIRKERDTLEATFRERMHAVLDHGTQMERSHVVAQCWAEALAVEERWHARLACPVDGAYSAAWSRMNGLAGINI